MPTSQTPRLSPLSRWSRILMMALCLPGLAAAAPRIEVPASTADFGKRRTGDQVSHTFRIRNTGDRVLRVTSIRPSCGCTTSDRDELAIPPGEERTVDMRIDLTGRVGPQNQYVTLTTNDPEHPAFSLKLSGTAVADVRIHPRTLNLGMLDPTNPAAGEVTLTSTTGKPFRVTRAKANRDRVDVEVDAAEDGRSTRIRVTPRKMDQDGNFTDVLLLDTDNPTARKQRVLVMWQISTGVTVAPDKVNLVLAEQEQVLNRYLMVKGYPGIPVPLQVTRVEWPGQEQVDIAFRDTGRFGWRIHLRNFSPGAEMDGTEIRIHTNTPGFEVLTVPVRVLQ